MSENKVVQCELCSVQSLFLCCFCQVSLILLFMLVGVSVLLTLLMYNFSASDKLQFSVGSVVLESDGTEIDGDEELNAFAGSTLWRWKMVKVGSLTPLNQCHRQSVMSLWRWAQCQLHLVSCLYEQCLCVMINQPLDLFPFLGGCWIKRQPGLRLIYRWPSYTGYE